MDTLIRIVFVLLAAAAGFLPGGLIVRALLGDRTRTGFDGVGEVFFGVAGGVLLGLILGIVISARLGRSGQVWGIVALLVVIAAEAALVVMLQR